MNLIQKKKRQKANSYKKVVTDENGELAHTAEIKNWKNGTWKLQRKAA